MADDLTSEDREAIRAWSGKLPWPTAPLLIMPTIDPAHVPDFGKPGRLVRVDKAELDRLMDEAAPVSIRDAMVQSVSTSFNVWLEDRLREAFTNGKDYAVTRLVGPDDRPALSPATQSWTETFRWQGQEIEPGDDLGPLWTHYRRPADWRPGWPHA